MALAPRPMAATPPPRDKLHAAAQHLDEIARKRQVRPAGLGADVEEHDAAGADLAGRSRAACRRQGSPRCARARSGVGSAKNLALDQHVVRARHAGEGAASADSRRAAAARTRTSAPSSARSPLRSITGTSGSSAGAAARRGPAKRISMPPASSHSLQRRIGLLRQAADIGHDHHGGTLFQEFGNGGGEVGNVGPDQVGIGRECLLDIVQRDSSGWLASCVSPLRSATRRRRKPSSSR